MKKLTFAIQNVKYSSYDAIHFEWQPKEEFIFFHTKIINSFENGVKLNICNL